MCRSTTFSFCEAKAWCQRAKNKTQESNDHWTVSMVLCFINHKTSDFETIDDHFVRLRDVLNGTLSYTLHNWNRKQRKEKSKNLTKFEAKRMGKTVTGQQWIPSWDALKQVEVLRWVRRRVGFEKLFWITQPKSNHCCADGKVMNVLWSLTFRDHWDSWHCFVYGSCSSPSYAWKAFCLGSRC